MKKVWGGQGNGRKKELEGEGMKYQEEENWYLFNGCDTDPLK